MKMNLWVIGGVGVVAVAIILVFVMVGGNKTLTFGEGDTKFSVKLVEGNYDITDGTGNDVVISGDLKLKLCNKGEKALPFVLEKQYGGIFVEFKQEDIGDVKETWINSIQKIQITSDEGLITLIPDECPTYSFSFRQPVGTDPTGKYGGFSKQAFDNARYYFFISDKKLELSGTKNLTLLSAEQVVEMKAKLQTLEQETQKEEEQQAQQEAERISKVQEVQGVYQEKFAKCMEDITNNDNLCREKVRTELCESNEYKDYCDYI